jgi:hypothetical protein
MAYIYTLQKKSTSGKSEGGVRKTTEEGIFKEDLGH